MKITDEHLRETIALALGEASMCWEPIPEGVFDSEQAVEVVNRLHTAMQTFLAVNTEHEKTFAVEAMSLCSWAWTIIANANGGNWDDAQPEWVTAAESWRDQWHALCAQRERSNHPLVEVSGQAHPERWVHDE